MVKISPSHLDSCKCFHVSAAIGIGPPAIAIAAVIGAVATATTIFGVVTFLQITSKTHVDRKKHEEPWRSRSYHPRLRGIEHQPTLMLPISLFSAMTMITPSVKNYEQNSNKISRQTHFSTMAADLVPPSLGQTYNNQPRPLAIAFTHGGHGR